MSNRPTIALLLIKGHEYAARLTEGALLYLEEHPGPEIVEISYLEGVAPPALDRLHIDAALVWADRNSPWVLDLWGWGVKMVCCSTEWVDEGIPSLAFDRQAVVEQAANHLAQLGPRQIAYVGHGISTNPVKACFRDEFFHAAGSRHLQPLALDLPDAPSEQQHRFLQPAGETELAALLTRLSKPVAIWCDDDFMGVLICQVAKHLGLSVPEDVAVLGLGDYTVARYANPTLSTIPQPGRLVGYEATQMLCEMLDGRPAPGGHVRISPPRLIQRESTGGTTLRDDDIERARQMIEQHACDGLTVSQLVSRFLISRPTLNKRFIAAYGRTPAEEIRRVGAEQAMRWLTATDLSIGRIGSMCGFSQSAKFNIFFKREVGCTPGEYRKRQA